MNKLEAIALAKMISDDTLVHFFQVLRRLNNRTASERRALMAIEKVLSERGYCPCIDGTVFKRQNDNTYVPVR